MAAELKPYPGYKDSGVEWLGAVPAHWKVRRLRTIAEMRVSNVDKHSRTGEQPVRLCNYVDVYTADRIRTGMPLMAATAASEEIERFRLRPGDVLITKDSEAWDDIGVPALVEGATDDTVCGYHLALLRPLSDCVSGGFLFRAVQSSAVAYQFRVRANGVTRYGLTHNGIKSTWLPVPPSAEQAAIVRFLDHADRRIRRYIRAKEKLIALLEEQKQVLIDRAVSRGVDAGATLRSTGILWFPEVPAHWGVLPLRRLIARSVDGPHHSPVYLDEGIPFLSARNIRVDRWSLKDVKFISRSDYDTFCRRVRPEVGDVLYTKGGTTGVARVVDLDYPFQVWVHVAVLKPRPDRVIPRYLATALNAARCYEQSQLLTRGATNQDLGLGRMKDIVLPVPPLVDQSRIIEHVVAVENHVGRAIRATSREIELQREYRTRLVADVITGKLDVREAAAGLPEIDTFAAEDDPDGASSPEVVSDTVPLSVTVQDGEA